MMRRVACIFTFSFLSILTYSQSGSPHLRYVYPKERSKEVNPKASLIFGFDQALTSEETRSFKVELTSAQKKYPVKYVLAENNRTIIVRPEQVFSYGESITVKIDSGLPQLKSRTYSFTITQNTCNPSHRNLPYDVEGRAVRDVSGTNSVKADDEPLFVNNVVVPSDFPVFEPSILDETAPGYLFLANYEGAPYIMILENNGTPRFYQKVEDISIDFKLQPSGVLTRHVSGDIRGFISVDSNYNVVDTFVCDNGYSVDHHDFQLLENGHALLIASESRSIDMSAIVEGGNPAANVTGTHIQEIDENGNAVFEFSCWENFDILGAIGIDLTSPYIDYVHTNSVAVDADGNIVISSRNLGECTKINRETGEIMWRLGGKYNQFEFIDEEDTIDYQHDLKPVPGVPGNYTIFDNGNHRGYSRVVEYQLDTVAMTATKVWEYRPEPQILTNAMGNAQRLDNGNTLINWAGGNSPKATEVTPEGEKVYEGNFAVPVSAYRSFRFEWDGYPLRPYLLIENLVEKVRLLYNLFGADSIAEYRIYGGTVRGSEELMTTTQEKWVDLSDLENTRTYYFKVTAVGNNGTESEFSNLDSILIIRPEPGVNLVRNGDFSEGQDYWDFYLYGGAIAETFVSEDGELVFDITNGGTMEVGVQLRQNGIPLIQGNHYIFEFDAWAASPRSIVAKVGMDVSPYSNYSRIGTTNITTEKAHYSYNFTMDFPTDLNSRVVFNCGLSSSDVVIDNVSLKNYIPENITEYTEGSAKIRIFPNPADQKLTIGFGTEIPRTAEIIFYSTDGRQWIHRNYYGEDIKEGCLTIDLSDLDQGIYFCSVDCFSASGQRFVRIFKPVVKVSK